MPIRRPSGRGAAAAGGVIPARLAAALRAAPLVAVPLFAAALFAAPAVHAQDAPPGDAVAGRKIVARSCAVCHGINGIAKVPDAANLAGQNADYLVRQLTAFRSGDRKNEIMSTMAQSLNDQQMRDVAAYFSAIAIQVKPPAPP